MSLAWSPEFQLFQIQNLQLMRRWSPVQLVDRLLKRCDIIRLDKQYGPRCQTKSCIIEAVQKRNRTDHSEHDLVMFLFHENDVIMGAIASQITSLAIIFSTVYFDTDQRKHQNSASPAFCRGIHQRPVNSPHKWPVTRKMFPFDDVIKYWTDMVFFHRYAILGINNWNRIKKVALLPSSPSIIQGHSLFEW